MLKRFVAALAALALSVVGFPTSAQIVGPLPYTLTNGQPADAAQVMANFNRIVNDVNTNVIFPSFTQQSYYAAAGGTADALTVTVSPAPTIYVPGMTIFAKIALTNSGATTINVNGLGLVNVVNPNGSTLRSSQLAPGVVAQMVYDGSQFQLQTVLGYTIRQAAFNINTSLYTVPGAWNFPVPAGVYQVRIRTWGGGGGGGRGDGTGAGSGGAGGALTEANLAVVPGDVLSGVVGAPGVAGTSAAVDGTAGGDTTTLLNGVLQMTAGGGQGGDSVAAGVCGLRRNPGIGSGVAAAFSVAGGYGQSCRALSSAGDGGSSSSGAFGGTGGSIAIGGNDGAGGGNPGGGGGGSTNTTGAGPGGNGWVLVQY